MSVSAELSPLYYVLLQHFSREMSYNFFNILDHFSNSVQALNYINSLALVLCVHLSLLSVCNSLPSSVDFYRASAYWRAILI